MLFLRLNVQRVGVRFFLEDKTVSCLQKGLLNRTAGVLTIKTYHTTFHIRKQSFVLLFHDFHRLLQLVEVVFFPEG